MNKQELVAQRLAEAEEKYGATGAAAIRGQKSAHQPPVEGLLHTITTPHQAEQVGQYLADFGNYPTGMDLCMVAGLNGDAAEGCPFAGTEHCTCDADVS
jgi:hypothetical protein